MPEIERYLCAPRVRLFKWLLIHSANQQHPPYLGGALIYLLGPLPDQPTTTFVPPTIPAEPLYIALTCSILTHIPP
ncbi:TPA: hypothetical protein DCY43_02410 [candidate division WWE3 bacterium]|uniref:Uncharacterized protein n=1 Tax=candidate division WWE3 bacterium TaxID=2053526 RepID=A0A351JTG1_UNCKA|nr:hypothetical protein [candidate division WWE3 bacterium]